MDNSIEIEILQKGGINLYSKEEVLNQDIELLKSLEYKIEDFNCEQISDIDLLHIEFQDRLNFPDYYGRNFDALEDCLAYDIEITDKGLAIILRHLDKFKLQTIQNLLNVFVRNAQEHYTLGRKLLILVQVNNPNFLSMN